MKCCMGFDSKGIKFKMHPSPQFHFRPDDKPCNGKQVGKILAGWILEKIIIDFHTTFFFQDVIGFQNVFPGEVFP